jgi:hypothetical protein
MKIILKTQENRFLKDTSIKNKKSCYPFFILFLLVAFNSFGSVNKVNVKQLNKTVLTKTTFDFEKEYNSDSWILNTTVNNVVFYHKLVSCGDKKAVLLKFENKNNFEVEVSWKQIVGSVQVPNPNDDLASNNTLVLKPGTTEPNDCSDIENDILVVLPNEVSPMFIADIETFNFSSIQIKELN